MAVTKLCGDNLRALRPLVLEALDYRQLRGVLADLIEEADPDLAGRLRRLQTYELALKAMDCGYYAERDAASRCRGLVRRYTVMVRGGRRVAWWHPGSRYTPRVGYALPLDDRCGLPLCGCGAYPQPRFSHLLFYARRSVHIQALVWRGLDGQAVPPDVQANLADLRNSIHFAVSQPLR